MKLGAIKMRGSKIETGGGRCWRTQTTVMTMANDDNYNDNDAAAMAYVGNNANDTNIRKQYEGSMRQCKLIINDNLRGGDCKYGDNGCSTDDYDIDNE
jgi:hypothetical protein